MKLAEPNGIAPSSRQFSQTVSRIGRYDLVQAQRVRRADVVAEDSHLGHTFRLQEVGKCEVVVALAVGIDRESRWREGEHVGAGAPLRTVDALAGHRHALAREILGRREREGRVRDDAEDVVVGDQVLAAVVTSVGLDCVSTETSLSLRPSTPPSLFSRSMRASAAPTPSPVVEAATPVSSSIMPIVMVLDVTPGLVSDDAAPAVADTERPARTVTAPARQLKLRNFLASRTLISPCGSDPETPQMEPQLFQ